MALDIDNLGPAPDIDTLDLAAMDRGDNLTPVEAPQVEADQEDEVSEEQVEKDLGVTDEKVETEEPPRDEKGKFTGKGEPKIPKSRFDEQVGKEREAREAAEKKVSDLERQLYAKEQEREQRVDRSAAIADLESQIDALTLKQNEAMLDGDATKAAEFNKQIRQIDRQIARVEVQEESKQTVEMSLEQERLQLTIAKLEVEHPMLNPKSETYEPDLVQMILLLQRDMVNTGKPAAAALADATAKVMGRLAKAPEQVVEKEGLSKAEIEDRKKVQVEKALAAQRKQPSSMKDSGMDSDKAGERELPDASKLTMEEYSALPEATRARLRGDLL